MAITIGGGVMAVAGLGFWALAAGKQSSIDDAPTATADDLDRLADLEDSGRRYASIGNGLVIAGGIAAAAGAVWWWRTHEANGQRPVVTPVVGPDGGGVMVVGRW